MTTTRILSVTADSPQAAPVNEAANVLRLGGLVAFPTETVYGLGANAFNAQAVAKIFEAKGRPASDPIIVHIHDVTQLNAVADNLPPLAFVLAREFWPGPLTMVLTRNSAVPSNVSAGMPTVAVRMPSHPVALALLRAFDLPIAAPSANRFARPSATATAHVLADLNGRIDLILDGGPAHIGVESTIIDLTKSLPVVLRPGGVTLERLRLLVPGVQLVSKHLHADEAGIEAPGMLYKHYSPDAKLILYHGNVLADVLNAMQSDAKRYIEQNIKVGLLLPDGEVANFDGLPVVVMNLGQDEAEISHRLFDTMRQLDQLAVDVILVHTFGQAGLGLALWDRLLRAAEGHVIEI